MSSKRQVRKKECTGKIRHNSSEEARKTLGSLFKSKRPGGLWNVYRCRFCGGFHIGHRPGQKEYKK